MTPAMLSADGQAIVLICSSLGLDDPRALKPLTPVEWHELTLALRGSQLERPRELLGRSRAELEELLDASPAMAERLERLLSRGGQLAFEVERLQSRGIWILTRADEPYPALLKERLRGQAPPVLFGAGNWDRLADAAVAVVGSRDVDEDGLAFAQMLGRRCAQARLAVVSGAARGVDAAAMQAALDAEGVAIGLTVDPLERLVRRRDLRLHLAEGSLVLATPFHPSARWHAGNAMRRNRLVYALSRAAVVVASTAGRGGTWAGAVENLKAAWVPLYVRDDGSAGNRELIADGGRPLLASNADGLDPAGLLDAVSERPRLEPVVQAEAASQLRDDLFEAIWPALAQYLAEPRSVDDVAVHFDLVATQARAWLKRAARADLVREQMRPRRYVVHGPEQERLFAPAHASA